MNRIEREQAKTAKAQQRAASEQARTARAQRRAATRDYADYERGWQDGYAEARDGETRDEPAERQARSPRDRQARTPRNR